MEVLSLANKRETTKKIRRPQYEQVEIDKHPHLTKSIYGILILFISLLLGVSLLFTSQAGIFGLFVKNTLYGLFGSMGIAFPIAVLYLGWIIISKEIIAKYNYKIISLFTIIALLSCFFYILFTGNLYDSQATFFHNISTFYQYGIDGASGNLSGGIIGGLLTVPLIDIFGNVGTIIILLTAMLIAFLFLTNMTPASIILSITSAIKTIPEKVNMLKIHNQKTKDLPLLEPSKQAAPLKEPVFEQPASLSKQIFDFEQEFLQESKPKKARPEPVEAALDNQPTAELNLSHNALKECDQNYKLPPKDILKLPPETGKSTSKKDLAEVAIKLEHTLSSFGVDAKVVNVSHGPTVTRFELSPGTGVKVSKIVGLADDLALNLAASGVRIEAPIPGKAAVGIEVPNKELSSVFLRELIDSQEFDKYQSNLAFAIGKDISGKIIVGDISKMPHVLIAGATGSGKSVCINTLITSILYKSRPEQVKLLMIDPKVVELGVYNGIPHLLIPVVTDPKKAAGALNWAVQEMVTRYNLFAQKGVRDIKGYNAALKEEGSDSLLPQIVIIIDELADLMMVAPNDVEDAICRLAQMARAAGMHLVIATQRPSVDVITGIIKANVPSRISFAVSSQVDSRTILDMAGAEKLLGKGDMLFYPVGEAKPIRLQGAFISDKEIESLVQFIKSQAETSYDENIIEKLESDTKFAEPDAGDNDPLLPQAIDLIMDSGQASISVIQRRFKVGYARAARLIDQMELRGIVGGFEGSKPRKVLMSKLQWEEMKNPDPTEANND
jgi:S-DNA-T family DNA segregation ATPase FtsK/SpoIIIE